MYHENTAPMNPPPRKDAMDDTTVERGMAFLMDMKHPVS